MKATLFLAILVAFAPAIASAEDAACHKESEALSKINAKYKSKYDDYENQGKDLKKDSVNFKFDITWKNVNIIFDTPSVTIRDKKLIFGVPQVTMRTQEIIFDTPSVKMVRIKTGQYPEFYCDTHTVIPKCTVRWSNTYADVPKTFMQRQHIKMGIPEFKWANTQVIMGVPEFFMQRQHWVLRLPQFKLKSAELNSGKIKARAKQLQSNVSTTRAAQVKEDGGAIHATYNCYRDQIQHQRAAADKEFTAALTKMDTLIKHLRKQGVNPAKIGTAKGQAINLVAKRQELAKQRAAALQKFDTAITKLNASEKKSIGELSAS